MHSNTTKDLPARRPCGDRDPTLALDFLLVLDLNVRAVVPPSHLTSLFATLVLLLRVAVAAAAQKVCLFSCYRYHRCPWKAPPRHLRFHRTCHRPSYCYLRPRQCPRSSRRCSSLPCRLCRFGKIFHKCRDHSSPSFSSRPPRHLLLPLFLLPL